MAKGTGNLPVPAAQTRGVDLRVVDYNEAEFALLIEPGQTSAFEATDPLQQGYYWRIERIVVFSTSAVSGVELVVYQGDNPIPQRGRDWTPMPPGYVAIAEYPSYLTIYPTSCLGVQVTGASPGDRFFVSAQYQVVIKVLHKPGDSWS